MSYETEGGVVRQEEHERQGHCEGERVRGGRCSLTAEHEQPRPSFAEKTISRAHARKRIKMECRARVFFCRILQSREAAAIPISVCKDTCLLYNSGTKYIYI